MNDRDWALSDIDDLAEILGYIEDRVDDARDELDRLRRRLDPAMRLVPPAAPPSAPTGSCTGSRPA